MCRPIFDLQDRINLLTKITAKDAEKIEVRQVEGLLVDFCEDNDIDFMVSLLLFVPTLLFEITYYHFRSVAFEPMQILTQSSLWASSIASSVARRQCFSWPVARECTLAPRELGSLRCSVDALRILCLKRSRTRCTVNFSSTTRGMASRRCLITNSRPHIRTMMLDIC